MTFLDDALYRDKVHACWIGKNSGGTLGAPFEGSPTPHDITYFEPVPREPMPNDDLELQLLWLILAEEHQWQLAPQHFTYAWDHYIRYGMDEYGVAKWNIRRGLTPPLTGLHNNWFVDGMGAAIRSEIWACLFPAQPRIAAHFAKMDASVDHHGDGVWAEMFLAAAESRAFVSDDLPAILRSSLEVIPDDCRIAQVVKFVIELHRRDCPLDELRQAVMTNFGSSNFTDCVMNLGFITAALLYGNKDFGATILTAVNFGMDTDCTAATCGSLLGIMLGSQAIDPRWTQPLGDDISIEGFQNQPPVPTTISDLTQRTIALRDQLQASYNPDFPIDLTQSLTADPLDDQHRWLIFTGNPWHQPDQLTQALQRPQDFTHRAISSPSIHLDLTQHLDGHQLAVYLLTHIVVPEPVDGYLMVTVGTGLSAWLDDDMIINYHGRLSPVPAVHRTEGGAAVRVKLNPNQPHALKLCLYFWRRGMTLTAAVFDNHGQYVKDFHFTL